MDVVSVSEVMQMKTSLVYYSAKSTPLVTEIFGFL